MKYITLFLPLKKILQVRLFFFLFFVSAFCGVGYYFIPFSSNEEDLFLENAMIRNGGLYVLMGSKPMIDFPIDSGFPETEAESLQSYQTYLSHVRKEKSPLRTMSYPEYLRECQKCAHLHHRKLWQCWKAKMDEYLGPNYRFFALERQGRKTGFFMSIPNMLMILKMNQEEFAKVYGEPFDPEQVLEEIEKPHSKFWSTLFQSSYTIGLLLGYGKRNALLFDLEQKEGKKWVLPRFADLKRKLMARSKKKIKVSDLPLPEFCTFCLGDEIMENYRQQRLQIIKEFHKQPFTATVKQWLALGKEPTCALREIRE